ncbi:MAG: PhoH family protein [Candidatus Moranbacteria bacterium]|nr:PhoH family protein [Candidatus Moranbacteria bacterium]
MSGVASVERDVPGVMTTVKPKLYVLDTSVLIHDPWSICRFKEHDVIILTQVLEELDHLKKKGAPDAARNARQVIRLLGDLAIGHSAASLKQGLPLGNVNLADTFPCAGKLKFQTVRLVPDTKNIPEELSEILADNVILRAALALLQCKNGYSDVIFVSKDINARIKAATLDIMAEDYHSDQSVSDLELLYTGAYVLDRDFWDTCGSRMESWKEKDRTFYRLQNSMVTDWYPNQFVYTDGDEGGDEDGFEAIVRSIDGDVAVLELLKDYRVKYHNIWGITAKNREQNFALNVLLDPEIDFVTLLGAAGTGKTLTALAAGLVMVMERKVYSEIIMTRETVPIGEDIGFLPGTEEDKMAPWMGALMDNLELLGSRLGQGEWEQGASKNILMNRVKIRSLNFMRGRTFLNRFLIVDEAQNLTSKQMKTLITRAGPGTKIICIGNLDQIDTPYLSATTSGLTYVVEHFKAWKHGAHITLRRGERSRLADFANDEL